MFDHDTAMVRGAEESGVGAEVEPENEFGEPLDADQLAMDAADRDEWKWREHNE